MGITKIDNLIAEAMTVANTEMKHDMQMPKGSYHNQYSVCGRCQCAVRVDHGEISGSALDTPCSSMASNELPGDVT